MPFIQLVVENNCRHYSQHYWGHYADTTEDTTADITHLLVNIHPNKERPQFIQAKNLNMFVILYCLPTFYFQVNSGK